MSKQQKLDKGRDTKRVHSHVKPEVGLKNHRAYTSQGL